MKKSKSNSLPTSSTAASKFKDSSTSGSASGARYHGLPTPSIDPNKRKGAIR